MALCARAEGVVRGRASVDWGGEVWSAEGQRGILGLSESTRREEFAQQVRKAGDGSMAASVSRARQHRQWHRQALWQGTSGTGLSAGLVAGRREVKQTLERAKVKLTDT